MHDLAFSADTREECLRAADICVDHGVEIEAALSKHAIAQGVFLHGVEPGGNRVEVTTGGRFVYAPNEPCTIWTEAAGAKAMLGRQDRRVRPHRRHPTRPSAGMRAR